jgi:general secretion pathway protein A
MYEAFYGLKEKPFSIQPDPDFLYLGRRHGLAYSMLEYSILNREGFAVICGDIGCGKTTLIRKLLNELGEDIMVGLVYNTHQEINNILEWIMLAFGQPHEGMSQVGLYAAFQRFLISHYQQKRRVVLIVDEAQNLNANVLETLRMLSNINADKDQLLQIILVGQPQLRNLLRRPDLQQFAQRVSVHFFIPPLEQTEVRNYINHRLHVAGRSDELFTWTACDRIAQASAGIPRSINILCDTSLVYAFSDGLQRVDLPVVEQVLKDKAEYGVLGDAPEGFQA